MQCPIVLLADPDAKYLRPLELKFLEELSGKIELEVITEPDYLRQYFESPRTIDILIIDEQWYEDRLEQHNINRIFILADSRSLIVSRRTKQYIFKYSSSNEIYRTVCRAMEGKLTEQDREKQKTKVVVVTSASGGTGKTTVALGLCANLAARMQRVLYIDAEHMNSFQCWLENCVSLNEAVYADVQYDMNGVYRRIKAYIGKEGFDYVPPLKAALVTLGISMNFYRTLLHEARESGDYDVIVVDTDTIFDEDKAFFMTFSDVLITVVNQTRSSVWAANELLKNVRTNSSEKYLFVCNNFDENNYNALVSSAENQSFIVNEYISHIKDYESSSLDKLKNNRDIQKLSYLVI